MTSNGISWREPCHTHQCPENVTFAPQKNTKLFSTQNLQHWIREMNFTHTVGTKENFSWWKTKDSFGDIYWNLPLVCLKISVLNLIQAYCNLVVICQLYYVLWRVRLYVYQLYETISKNKSASQTSFLIHTDLSKKLAIFWVAGSAENITISVQLKLGLGLSLAIKKADGLSDLKGWYCSCSNDLWPMTYDLSQYGYKELGMFDQNINVFCFLQSWHLMSQ